MALLRGVAGRLLVLAVLVLGVRLELLPRVLGLLIGPVAVFFAILEIVAATAYARSADRLSSAVFQAAVLGWVLAAVMPLG